jgi:hypothetical protein
MAVVATQGKRPRLGAQRRRPLGLELVVSLDEGYWHADTSIPRQAGATARVSHGARSECQPRLRQRPASDRLKPSGTGYHMLTCTGS